MKIEARTALERSHRQDVGRLGGAAEPGRARQRLDHGGPHQDPGPEEAEVLEGVESGVVDGGLVEAREVPGEEDDRPDRQSHQGMGEDPESADHGQRENRAEDGTGQAEHDRQGRQVPEHQVLDHVHVEEVALADRVDRRDQRSRQQQQAEVEAGLPQP